MRVTVFTPTYNRARLIHRVYESLLAQTYKGFEWVIIDDGSTDDTEEVVKEFASVADFEIKYFKRSNKGKAASINEALTLADGEFFLVFDSDDWCIPDALEKFLGAWDALQQPDDYCAVSALKGYSRDTVVGEDYSRMSSLGESYADRFNKRVKGDKWEFIRTSIHRDHTYQLFGEERYQAPEYAWLGMGRAYKTVFLNEILGVVEYQADGISKNNLKHRRQSPLSTYSFYTRAREVADNWGMALRCEVNGARFALHGRTPSLAANFGALAITLGAVVFMKDLIFAAFLQRPK